MVDIGKLKVDGKEVYPITHAKAIIGLSGEGTSSKVGRRNYLLRTNSGHTNIMASDTNSFDTNLTVENVGGYKVHLTNSKALKDNYYRFMFNEFGVLRPGVTYYFNGYLQLGAESTMRFTVYSHTSASNKSVVIQETVSDEGDFSIPFMLPNFGNLTGITIQVEVVNAKGEAYNKSTDNIYLFNLILALSDGDWVRALEDFASSDEYVALNSRVTALEGSAGDKPNTSDDTGWLDVTVNAPFKASEDNPPKYRILNGAVYIMGEITGIAPGTVNTVIATVPYEAAPQAPDIFTSLMQDDGIVFAKMMMTGDGGIRFLFSSIGGTVILNKVIPKRLN